MLPTTGDDPVLPLHYKSPCIFCEKKFTISYEEHCLKTDDTRPLATVYQTLVT